MKKEFILLYLLFFTLMAAAQHHQLLKSSNFQSSNSVRFNKINASQKKINNHIYSPSMNLNIKQLEDTLKYDANWNTDFGIFGQDWVLQWFQAPADMQLLKVGFSCATNPDTVLAEIKVVKLNWNYAELDSSQPLQGGFYEAIGNGYNDITALLDNPDRTGGWTSIPTVDTEPFGEDLWSDNGNGFQFLPVPTADPNVYQWVDIATTKNVVILGGELFGIAVKNVGSIINENRLGFWSGNGDYTGWKFYSGANGWWSRDYIFNMAVEVYLSGSCFFRIRCTVLKTTTSSELRVVDAQVYAPQHPIYATLHYSTDFGQNWISESMNYINDNNYQGIIPGFPPGTNVSYYITAIDSVTNCEGYSVNIQYTIFGPSGAKTLVAFNGFPIATGYPESYYFGSGDWPNSYNTLSFSHDVWAYGSLTDELVSNYMNIIEICTEGPNEINSDVIKAWLQADGNRNYLLAGDEWLGSQTSWRDTTYIPGSFQYDILGIKADHNDVNYLSAGDDKKASIVFPQPSTLLGGELHNLYEKIKSDSGWTSPMTYDPFFEINTSNWLDGVDFVSDVEVDMKGLAGDSITVYNIGGHRTLAGGNKIAFIAYDPLSLDSDSKNMKEYYWHGFSSAAPQVQALNWFGIPVTVENIETDQLPLKYSLFQNYPNPFNPITKIRFTIPENPPSSPFTKGGNGYGRGGFVTLKVYDVLGNEVTTLVNEEKPAGNYEVEFNGSKLSSGVYFYRLNAGSFIQTKKMILMK